jgi:sigma-B regulation protein RsbU (phosphoserine phosphatase)
VSEDRYRVLFEHSSDGHIVIQDGGIIDCNQAALDLIGCQTRAEMLDLHPSVLSPELQPDGTPSSEVAARVDALAYEKGFHRFEFMHQTVDGQPLPVEVTLNSVQLESGPALVAVWHDLREIKRREREQKRLADALQEANARMTRDLEAAAAVQSALLPHVLPDVEGLGIEWAFQPCDELAGDILDVFLLDPRHLAFYVLDVSGHGVASSLLSVTASHFLSPGEQGSFFRGGGTRGARRLASPMEIVERLNEQVKPRGGPVQFLTLFCGILDLDTRKLRFTCAAHPGAMRLSPSGDVQLLEHPGLPLGIMADVQYEEESITLEAGDRLLVFSDGIPEARNEAGEQFGLERLRAAVQSTRDRTLRDEVDAVVRDVRAWCAPHEPQDDISLLALELRP